KPDLILGLATPCPYHRAQCRLMGWSGRAPAPPAIRLGEALKTTSTPWPRPSKLPSQCSRIPWDPPGNGTHHSKARRFQMADRATITALTVSARDGPTISLGRKGLEAAPYRVIQV